MKVKLFFAALILSGFLVYCNTGCTDSREKVIKEGKELAHVYCASCHAFPDPAMLNKIAWSDVLPKIAELMRVDAYYNPFDISGPEGDQPATRAGKDQLFPYEKWEKIVKYYMATAPVNQPARIKELPPVETGLKNFAIHSLYNKVDIPFTTMVKMDTVRRRILFADGNAQELFISDTRLKVIDSFRVFTGATDINLEKNPAPVISMGILKPSDGKLGKLALALKGKDPVIIIDSLQRPVHSSYADLNGDQKEDIVISEFGFRHGALAWFENVGKDHYEKHLLRDLPGATRTEVFDFNLDGKPDIIALMAQADEGIFIYYNEGNGKFREERVLQFSPEYGSNYFQLVDFNGDGLMDILATNGDNADYSMVLKAFHGIRIFLNDGTNHFTEKTFLPVYGVQKAVPADIDNDGDMDIVSISFFPDYEKHPEESFVVWENTGNSNFRGFTFEGVTDGRWITLDVGDMDRDGDQDIILGNAVMKFGKVPAALMEKWNMHSPSVVLLENTMINN